MDAVKNFAKATVSTGYDSSATSITLASGHGARMPAPPFNAIWWNWTDTPDMIDDADRELVRVTAVAGDVLTIMRGQEDTAASDHNEGGKTYLLAAILTARMFNEMYELFVVQMTNPDEDADVRLTNRFFAAQAYALLDPLDVTLFAGDAPPTDASLVVDIKVNDVSIFSTAPSIDDGEADSTTSSTPAVLTSDPDPFEIAQGDKIEFFITQKGVTDPGTGITANLKLRKRST